MRACVRVASLSRSFTAAKHKDEERWGHMNEREREKSKVAKPGGLSRSLSLHFLHLPLSCRQRRRGAQHPPSPAQTMPPTYAFLSDARVTKGCFLGRRDIDKPSTWYGGPATKKEMPLVVLSPVVTVLCRRNGFHNFSLILWFVSLEKQRLNFPGDCTVRFSMGFLDLLQK